MKHIQMWAVRFLTLILVAFLSLGFISSGFSQYQTIDESYVHPRVNNPGIQVYYHQNRSDLEPASKPKKSTRACLRKCSLRCVDHRVSGESFGECSSNCDQACSR